MRTSHMFLYVYEVKININVFSEFNLKEANKIKKNRIMVGWYASMMYLINSLR